MVNAELLFGNIKVGGVMALLVGVILKKAVS
jgi:hypothetical protein